MLSLNFLNKYLALLVKIHENAQTILGVSFRIQLLSSVDLIYCALRTIHKVEIHKCNSGDNLTVHLVLHLLRELEAERHIKRIMNGLHKARHHHAGRTLHHLGNLRHSWVSHHHLLLHKHFLSGLNSHVFVLWLSMRHHHLGILRSPPYSLITSHASCGKLLLLHHLNWHLIASIWIHVRRLATAHLHLRRCHHLDWLMRHWSLLSHCLLSQFVLTVSKRAAIFVRAILS